MDLALHRIGAALLVLSACSVPGVDYTGKLCPCSEPPYLCHPDGFCVAGPPDHPRCDEGGVFELSAGDTHTCSLECGALYCWGESDDGRLGLGAIGPDVEHPTRVGTRTDWVAVSAGSSHTCAIDVEQDTYCWGSNASGEIGIGTFGDPVPEPTIIQAFGGWLDVSAGAGHTCGVRRDGTLWCWGSDSCGKLGLGTIDVDVGAPAQVDAGGAPDWRAVSAGNTLTCALRDDGSVWCWGCNDNGQMANGTPGPPVLLPQRVDHPRPFTVVDVGQQHACAIDDAGTLSCWGLNEGGQLGIGTMGADVPAVTAVDTSTLYDDVEADAFSGCALVRADRSVRCWGYDLDGMVGRGVPESDYQLAPAAVVGVTGALRDLAVGRFHTCVRLDGTLALSCVGNDESGQLGTGAPSRRNFTFAPVTF